MSTVAAALDSDGRRRVVRQSVSVALATGTYGVSFGAVAVASEEHAADLQRLTVSVEEGAKLVAGGASGIGAAYCRQIAATGIDLLILDRDLNVIGNEARAQIAEAVVRASREGPVVAVATVVRAPDVWGPASASTSTRRASSYRPMRGANVSCPGN